jgi:uncharacterized protein
MGRRLFPFVVTLCLLLLSSTAWAITVPPQPKGPVYDGADVLTPDQEKKLEKKLNGFRDNQGRPVVVAIIPSLEGDNIREAGYDIAQGWGIGTKGKNDGVLLLLVVDKAKKAGPGAKKCGCASIEVGEYLEGDLTDSTVVSILKKEVLAPVVSGKFYEAANGGSKGIMAVLGGDAEAAKAYKNSSDGGGDDYSWFFELHWFLQLLLVLLAIFVLVIFVKMGGGGSGGGYGGGYRSGGSWGGGSSGSSGGSSYGGGSFGGGGGSV